MNHRGQITILYTLMMAVVVILFVIGIAPTLKIFTEEARAPSSDTAVGFELEFVFEYLSKLELE